MSDLTPVPIAASTPLSEPAQGACPVLMIVDDDTVCVMALQRALRKGNVGMSTIVASDGQEALEKLRDLYQSSQSLPPVLVSLDLNMPRMDGIEFLAALRADKLLRKVIVFVYSTSDAPSDIAACYDHNVAGYLLKEHDSSHTFAIGQLLKHYAETVELPR